ncbi:serine/threonine protein kinase [Archangium lansingense]|uniref:serine/threonine protein kinase n=1 Tax=Archangium lansingense TaxID=2995310 RepID=UPI003B7B4D8E
MRRPRHPNQLRAGDRVRDFRVVRRLGVGGFAFVFLVERGGRRSTLKMAARPPSREDEVRVDDWMRRERVSLECVEHPHLLPVEEWGRWPDSETGYAYFVMPYVPASTFHVWRWRERASLSRSVGVLCELLKPLEALHERGVVHRDMKADNVLVREGDDAPFLIDFGAAHLPWGRPLTEGLAPGTLYCQPPEAIAFLLTQASRQGSRLEARPSADIYMFGVLLYEVLTSCRPVGSRWTLEQMLVAIATAPPLEPRLLAPDAPASLCALTLRLLAKEPEQRPVSARAVREELERWRTEEGHLPSWTSPAKHPSELPGWKERFPDVDVLELAPEEPPPPARPSPSRKKLGAACALGLVLLGVGWLLLRKEQSVPSNSTETPLVPFSSAPEPSWLCRRLGPVLGVAAAQLLGCATTPVRPDPIGYLSRCPPEARATPVRLGFTPSEYPIFFHSGTPATPAENAPIEEGAALNLKPGPVSVYMIAFVGEKDVEYTISGEAVTLPHRVYIQFDRLHLPDGSTLPICGVAVDGLHQYGIPTFAKLPTDGVTVDADKVDKSPGSVVLDGPRWESVVQFPEGHRMPRIRLAPPDWR